MKRIVPIVLIIVVAAALVYYLVVLRNRPAQAPASPIPTATSGGATRTALPPIQAEGQVVADAVVVPVRSAELSLPTSGIVAEILVQEGDQVEAGQTILRLESAGEQASVAQAEAGLRSTQASLAELKAGPRPEEIDSAQATVDAAAAEVQRLEEGALAEEIDAAEAALDRAQAELNKVLEGPTEEQLAAAQGEVNNAAAKTRQAQAAYDEVSWREDIGRLPQSLDLEQATNDLLVAQARLDDLQRGATAAEIASAQAEVRRAQAEVDVLKVPPRPSALASAQADLRGAQAELALLVAGARPEAIEAAEAEVASAQATLDQALASLADLELRASFDGTVVEIVPSIGEQVTAGTAIVRLADLSAWQVETDDLTEFNVYKIAEGNPATIEFDAIPGLTIDGQVQSIKAIGENKQGDITYTVVVIPDRFDERLRWNMTAAVTIETP